MEKLENKNVLFTGLPGCGKSTLIEKVVEGINRPGTGFFTRELREKGHRVGFSINTLDGKQGLLAHQDIKGRYRVGRYGVNLDDIDRVAVPSMIPASEDMVVVIDEIGKMECFSPLFRATLIQILNSKNLVIGFIALKGDLFIQQIKKRKDILLIHVSYQNRDRLVNKFFDRIMAWVNQE